MEPIIVKAIEILKRSQIVIIASINTDGYPRPVPVAGLVYKTFPGRY